MKMKSVREPKLATEQNQVLRFRHGLHTSAVQVAAIRDASVPSSDRAAAQNGLPTRHHVVRLRPGLPGARSLVRQALRQPAQGRRLRQHHRVRARLQVPQVQRDLQVLPEQVSQLRRVAHLCPQHSLLSARDLFARFHH